MYSSPYDRYYRGDISIDECMRLLGHRKPDPPKRHDALLMMIFGLVYILAIALGIQ